MTKFNDNLCVIGSEKFTGWINEIRNEKKYRLYGSAAMDEIIDGCPCALFRFSENLLTDNEKMDRMIDMCISQRSPFLLVQSKINTYIIIPFNKTYCGNAGMRSEPWKEEGYILVFDNPDIPTMTQYNELKPAA